MEGGRGKMGGLSVGKSYKSKYALELHETPGEGALTGRPLISAPIVVC